MAADIAQSIGSHCEHQVEQSTRNFCSGCQAKRAALFAEKLATQILPPVSYRHKKTTNCAASRRARYEAECARQHCMLVDSLNRLVARSLEADWNDKLRTPDRRVGPERHPAPDRGRRPDPGCGG